MEQRVPKDAQLDLFGDVFVGQDSCRPLFYLVIVACGLSIFFIRDNVARIIIVRVVGRVIVRLVGRVPYRSIPRFPSSSCCDT